MNFETLELYLKWVKFDPNEYRKLNPDVRRSGVDPVEHFVHFGRFERRAIRNIAPAEIAAATKFDRDYYLKNNPDVASSGADPLEHFSKHGLAESRAWSPQYDYHGDRPFWECLAAICGESPESDSGFAEKCAFLRSQPKPVLRAAIRDLMEDERPVLFRRTLGLVLGYAALLADAALLAEGFYQAYMNAVPYLDVQGPGARWCNVYPVRRIPDHIDPATMAEVQNGQEVELPEIEFLGRSPGAFPARTARLPPAYLVALEDAAFISSTSIIITADKTLLYDDAVEMCSDPERDVRNPLMLGAACGYAALLVPRQERTVEEGAVMFNDHAHNYFHWLVELAPKLKFLTGSAAKNLLTEAGQPPQIQSIIRQFCPKATVQEFRPYEMIRVKRATVVSDLSRVVVRTRAAPRVDDYVISPVALQIVRNAFSPAMGKRQADLKLYVSRPNPNFRRLLNATNLMRFLTLHGYRAVYTGELSIARQVGWFSTASVAIGEAGAAMANILFCAPGAEIVILTNGNPATNYYFFAQLAAAAGARLRYYIGWENRYSHEVPVQNDYIVDIDDLADHIGDLSAPAAAEHRGERKQKGTKLVA